MYVSNPAAAVSYQMIGKPHRPGGRQHRVEYTGCAIAYDQQGRETFDAAHASLRQAANAAEWAAGYEQVSAAYLATVTSVADTALAEMKEAVHPFRPAGVLGRGTENHFRFRYGFARSVESIAECHTQALSEMIETLKGV